MHEWNPKASACVLIAALAMALVLPATAFGEPTENWTQWGGPGHDFKAPAEGLADSWGRSTTSRRDSLYASGGRRRTTVYPEWWQVPAARADLERVLSGMEALQASPPRGETAYFCDLCEVLTLLLDSGASFAACREEEHAVQELRSRLDRRLAATTYVDPQAIEVLEHFEQTLISSLLAEPQKKLAVYGTLAPGEVNHSQLAGIHGAWTEGFVRGELMSTGWGAEHGFPALAWRPGGPRVPAKLFIAPGLDRHWQRLDDFEGDGYRRILVPVEDDRGIIAVANLYADRSVAEEG